MSAPSHFFESLGPPSFETFRFPNIADVFDRLSSFPVLPPPKMALSRIIYIYYIYNNISYIYIYVHMLYDLSWYTGSTHPVGIQSTSTQSNTTSSRSQLRRAPSNLAMRPAAGVPSGPGIWKGFQEKCHMWSYEYLHNMCAIEGQSYSGARWKSNHATVAIHQPFNVFQKDCHWAAWLLTSPVTLPGHGYQCQKAETAR
jgi:hypothetical protein